MFQTGFESLIKTQWSISVRNDYAGSELAVLVDGYSRSKHDIVITYMPELISTEVGIDIATLTIGLVACN